MRNPSGVIVISICFESFCRSFFALISCFQLLLQLLHVVVRWPP